MENLPKSLDGFLRRLAILVYGQFLGAVLQHDIHLWIEVAPPWAQALL